MAAHQVEARLCRWRRGMKKAIVALARRLAVTMHRIWVDGTRVPLDKGNRSSMKGT
jgi:hypothetical protein